MSLNEIINEASKPKPKCIVYVISYESPIGNIIAGSDESYLYFVIFEDSKKLVNTLKLVSEKIQCKYVISEEIKLIQKFKHDIINYFAGKLTNFSTPIKTFGSDFQKEVWLKLQEIPYGTTNTYAGLAHQMGRSSSHARAVGAACGANSHVIVIPCHRLVASSTTGGFSCGVNRKEWLLKHEKN